MNVWKSLISWSNFFFKGSHKMTIPNWKLMPVLTRFYLCRTCASFSRNSWSSFLRFSALSSSRHSLAASASMKLLSAACWYSIRDSNILSNFVKTSEAVFLFLFAFKTADWRDTGFFVSTASVTPEGTSYMATAKPSNGCLNMKAKRDIKDDKLTFGLVISILHCNIRIHLSLLSFYAFKNSQIRYSNILIEFYIIMFLEMLDFRVYIVD